MALEGGSVPVKDMTDHDEAVRVGIGQRLEVESVQDAENGRVCTDTKSERGQDGDREGWAFAEQPQGEADVVPQIHTLYRGNWSAVMRRRCFEVPRLGGHFEVLGRLV